MAKNAKKHTAGSAKKQKKRVVSIGIAHISATYNNTLISVTDPSGNVLGFSSSGKHFKGSRKSTPYAAQVAAKDVAGRMMADFNMREIHIRVTGAGSGRDSAIRGLVTDAGSTMHARSDEDGKVTSGSGLRLLTIEDITPQPHNGCRAKKKRRV